jgi:tRNA uracil 4-sulfurtransferase
VYDHILVRYGEINTKGNNRSQLERLLLSNIQATLTEWKVVKVSRISSRILVRLQGAPQDLVMSRLQKVFGISSMSPVVISGLQVEHITKTAISLLTSHAEKSLRFKVEVRRGNKRFEMNSPELATHVGGAILEKYPHFVVDVHDPETTVHIDVRDHDAYLYADKVEGAGGLPVGMSGAVGGLLSGGIDSPVAVWQSLKRGLSVDLVHFHSFPFTSERAQRKVEDLARTVAQWSKDLNLYLVSLTEVQSAIAKHCPEMLRTVLMRRMMFRISTELGRRFGWSGLVTGDSLGQVASQTLDAIHVVDRATDLSVFRPLVMEDKLDIIRRAKEDRKSVV